MPSAGWLALLLLASASTSTQTCLDTTHSVPPLLSRTAVASSPTLLHVSFSSPLEGAADAASGRTLAFAVCAVVGCDSRNVTVEALWPPPGSPAQDAQYEVVFFTEPSEDAALLPAALVAALNGQGLSVLALLADGCLATATRVLVAHKRWQTADVTRQGGQSGLPAAHESHAHLAESAVAEVLPSALNGPHPSAHSAHGSHGTLLGHVLPGALYIVWGASRVRPRSRDDTAAAAVF